MTASLLYLNAINYKVYVEPDVLKYVIRSVILNIYSFLIPTLVFCYCIALLHTAKLVWLKANIAFMNINKMECKQFYCVFPVPTLLSQEEKKKQIYKWLIPARVYNTSNNLSQLNMKIVLPNTRFYLFTSFLRLHLHAKYKEIRVRSDQ